MRAFVLPAARPVEERPLSLSLLPVPRPGRREVLVRVSVCGVCRTDLHVCEGELEPRKGNVVPGHQAVGTIVALGEDAVGKLAVGERVGAAWLAAVCGTCKYCRAGLENLCDRPEFNGWTRNGGFAEYMTAPIDFLYRLSAGFADEHAAPLLCAGIIGYRALRLTGIENWKEARLGIYGFGAAGHIAIQLARHRGAGVYVMTRDRERHAALARELGAVWVGDTYDAPPVELDAGIVFAPAGEIVPPALAALRKGGVLVLGGIHMSPIPEFEYRLLYGEREIRSVANNTRADGDEFLEEADRAGIRTSTVEYPFERLPEALIDLKHDAVRGAAVVMIR